LRLPGAGRPSGLLQLARRLCAPPGSRLPGAADRNRVRRRLSPPLPRPVRAGLATQRTVRGRGVGAAAGGEAKRFGLVRQTPQASYGEAVPVTLNLSPAGGSIANAAGNSWWIHPQETTQRRDRRTTQRGARRTTQRGARRNEMPDERERRRVSDPEGGVDQLEIGVLRGLRGLRRPDARPIAGAVTRPADRLPGRGLRTGPALLRTHLGGDAHGARVRGHILDDHGIGPDRGV